MTSSLLVKRKRYEIDFLLSIVAVLLFIYIFRRLGFHATRPVVPIAVGRSRRHVAKVDYKFGAYDELIQVC